MGFFKLDDAPPRSVLAAGAFMIFLIFAYVWVEDFRKLECSKNYPSPTAAKVNGGDGGGAMSPCSGVGVTMTMISAYVKVIVIALAIAMGFFTFDAAVVSMLLRPPALYGVAPPLEPDSKPSLPFGVQATLVWLLDHRMRQGLLAAAFTTMCFAILCNMYVEVRGGDAELRFRVARGIYFFQMVVVVGALVAALT